MGNNPSVRQFKTDMKDFANSVSKDFYSMISDQADELVGNIQRAIHHSVTGNLSKSIRKKDVSKLPEKVSFLVLGGGHLTTKREKSGVHDYSVDVEFGDRNHPPEPFFYSTARLYMGGGHTYSAGWSGGAPLGQVEQFQETLDEAIKENNAVRALRSSNVNYTTGGFGGAQTRSVGGRGGAIVIQKG